MYRTTTTATLLVTVAVSALCGCVTVRQPPLPGPPAAPSQPSAPRGNGEAEPRIVQDPAREALGFVGAPRQAQPAAQERRGTSTENNGPALQPPSRRTQPQTPPARSRAHQQPRAESSGMPEDIGKDADVCTLGRKYGGWRADSPEARACEQAYGR